MTLHAAPIRLQTAARALRRPGTARSVPQTAGFNVAALVAVGLGGVIIARALGPTVRGEYAALTTWFGLSLIVGDMGHPAVLCFYVSSDPKRARQYVATSRALTMSTGLPGTALVWLLVVSLSFRRRRAA